MQRPGEHDDTGSSRRRTGDGGARHGTLALLTAALLAAGWMTREAGFHRGHPPAWNATPRDHETADIAETVRAVNRALRDAWMTAGVEAVGPADARTRLRRLSLALTGTVPSLEEWRRFEAAAPADPEQWWLARLFRDPRFGSYLAERLARMTVGVEAGPFIVYRRHRLLTWIEEALLANRPYDEMVRALITAEGVWTTHPEANFLTVTIDPNNEAEGPDEIKLAGRVAKAFLGVRLDCVQCHDDYLGKRWEQEDFHQLAAFFAGAKMELTGVRDDESRAYRFRLSGSDEPEPLDPAVPFRPELLPTEGTRRTRLAAWVTHPDNRAFARAAVNRVWAWCFNRPLHEPVDDLPLDGPFPAGLEVLADDFIAHGFDLQHLIRVIVATDAFRHASRSADPERPVSPEQEALWAAFPLTRLRPEQVAGSILQASSLKTIDARSHVLRRITRLFGEGEFVRRYGDSGENELQNAAGTITQRLILMNGKLVYERTKEDLVVNASTRLAALAPDPAQAVATAFLVVLGRTPTPTESDWFGSRLADRGDRPAAEVMEDLFWTLINATEFSWNH